MGVRDVFYFDGQNCIFSILVGERHFNLKGFTGSANSLNQPNIIAIAELFFLIIVGAPMSEVCPPRRHETIYALRLASWWPFGVKIARSTDTLISLYD